MSQKTTKLNQGLFLIAVTMATFGLSRATHAEELPKGVKVDTSLWAYAYAEDGSRDNVYQSSLNDNQNACVHRLKKELAERAESNPQLGRLLNSGKYLVQFDLSWAFDGNAYHDAVNDSTVIYDQKHLYVRVPLMPSQGEDYQDVSGQNCKLPEVFDQKFPALVPNFSQALRVLNSPSIHGEKVSQQKVRNNESDGCGATSGKDASLRVGSGL